jgi:sugar phosphate permease
MTQAETHHDDRPGLGKLLWVLWLTYGSFYFCRTNISAALPGIEAELELTKTQMGVVLGSLKLAYGIGQLVNGQLAERFPPRALLAIGMFGSAALNVVFGFGTALYFFLFVWACNGYLQAFGWTPTMRVAANWIPVTRRGTAIGIIGTGYQAIAAVTFVVAGFSADLIGWRGALFVPAGLFALAGVHMLMFLQESPDHAQPAAVSRRGTARGSLRHNIAVTLKNPALWLLALALGLLNASRYGFLDWGLTHLTEVQQGGVGRNALKYAVLPLGGIAGAFASGWATDRFFGGRRAPVICCLLVALGLSAIVYNRVVETGVAPTVLALVLVGFSVYGAQVLLVGTAPIDFAHAGTAAAAVGFVNFMGYMGAFAGDAVTGRLVDQHGWETAVYFWSGCAFVAAAIVAILWRRTAESNQEPT